jgi:hypothetical protein
MNKQGNTGRHNKQILHHRVNINHHCIGRHLLLAALLEAMGADEGVVAAAFSSEDSSLLAR